MRRYRFVSEQFTSNRRIISNCGGITFYNAASAPVLVNNFPVASGATLDIQANENELDVTEYDLDFQSAICIVYVLKKIYL